MIALFRESIFSEPTCTQPPCCFGEAADHNASGQEVCSQRITLLHAHCFLQMFSSYMSAIFSDNIIFEDTILIIEKTGSSNIRNSSHVKFDFL